MQPLIDGDILLYEVGFAAEVGNTNPDPPSFDYAATILDSKIANICAITNATQPPIIALTGSTNFRNEIAKKHPYKKRTSFKPFHYYNLKAYIKGKYEYVLHEGVEADDLMAIIQCSRNDTIICSRDKDLRAVPGWHYGWEVGKQAQFGPAIVSKLGEIRLSSDRKSIKGEGLLFFYSQCLTGDMVDTIPGLPGIGAVNAFAILHGAKDEQACFKAVLEAYRGLYGDSAEVELLEQGRLLWMTRQMTKEGKPVLWELPKIEQEMEESGQKLDIAPSSKEVCEVSVSDGRLVTKFLTLPN